MCLATLNVLVHLFDIQVKDVFRISFCTLLASVIGRVIWSTSFRTHTEPRGSTHPGWRDLLNIVIKRATKIAEQNEAKLGSNIASGTDVDVKATLEAKSD